VDILFLGHYGFIEEISYFEIMNKVLMILLTPFLIIGQVIAPNITIKFVRKDFNGIRASFKKYFFFSVCMIFLILPIFYVLFKPVMTILLGQYNINLIYSLLNIMFIVFITQILNSIIPMGFVVSTGHAKLSAIFLVVFGLVNIVLDYVFINIYGFMGVAYATVITKCTADILFMLTYYNILKKMK
jgi:Na+-driven multidrug efflux pump